MVTVKECAMFAGLASNEMIVGKTPSATHRVLLSGYLLNLWRGPKRVRKMLVADIRMWLDFGMPNHAADLLIVLRKFLSEYPESRLERRSWKSPVRNIHLFTQRGFVTDEADDARAWTGAGTEHAPLSHRALKK